MALQADLSNTYFIDPMDSKQRNHDPSFQLLPEFTHALEMEGQALLECVKRLRQTELSAKKGKGLVEAFDLLKARLDGGGKIVVTGVGKSGKIGQKIAATLCSTGSMAVFLHPTDALHGDLGLLQPSQDALLALSYTGNTEELVRMIEQTKKLKIASVGLGGNPESRLAELCDAWIDGKVDQEACPHNLAPTSSTTLALALGDALAVSLMKARGFKPEDFARNHPGGSLGSRLNLKVADIMRGWRDLGLVEASASMEQVIEESTRKKLGAVLVIENRSEDSARLLGVITDGDLRRALRHRDQFFGFKAEEVMTKNPVVISPDLLAHEALQVMENRPSQISVLPVTQDSGRLVGLVRLHDLVRIF